MTGSLFAKRLIVVTGKGGVGKSSVAAALALCAARRGLRVLVCETGLRERLATLLGGDPTASGPQVVAGGVHCLHVRPADALHEYALMRLKLEALYRAVFENEAVRAFLRLVPSLSETVTLGKVWFEAAAHRADGRPRWDLVVLDAPASGHVVSFLGVPRTLLQTVPAGPLRDEAERMQATLTDPAQTSVELVTLPEELPVTELLELLPQLRALELPLGRALLNAFVADRFAPAEVELFTTRTEGTTPSGPLSPQTAAAWAGRYQARRAERSRASGDQLRRAAPDLPLVTLPRLARPEWGLAAIEALADPLDEALR